MYNGVGLTTARGSGTNGYIQRSLAFRSFRDDSYGRSSEDSKRKEASSSLDRKPDAGILEHERKRKVEVRCMELRMELEDKDLPEAEIEEKVVMLRKTL
ncbi:cwf21-domain-containing protein, partial [Tilletiaria anomala UBC 951]